MNDFPVPDRAAYARVWRRVMPEDRPDCPFTLDPPVPAPLPAQQPPVRQPAAQLPVCLGEAAAAELPALEGLMALTAQTAADYLPRRRDPLLAALAAGKGRQLRRLSAAHFLISGKPYSPLSAAPRQAGSLSLLLRACYHAEQRAALSFLTAAAEVSDPCLNQLYREIGAENQTFAGRIRERLEQM